MSILVVGLSHYSAPVSVLERASLRSPDLGKFLHEACGADGVSHCFALSTCHRAEVYAQVGAFHSAVTGICDVLARHCGMSREELTPYLYVHYGDRAVQHLIAVACGLDSMVVGESQILGQVRAALKVAAEQGTLGRALSELGSSALRAGKRAHTKTRIVNEALSAHLLADRAASVGPTVAALRAKAEQVVEAELARLARRLEHLDAPARNEISRAMHRVADKLLHSPTVRVKELVGSPGASSYETALRVLFDLDTTTVRAVTTADADVTGWLDRHDEEPAS